MRLLKSIILLLGCLLGCLVVFYFYGTSSILDKTEYHQLKLYPFALPQIKDSTITVVSYNIGYLSGSTNNRPIHREISLFDENLRKSKQLLFDLNPDVIGFQEIDFGSARSFYRHQLDSLSHHLKIPNAFQSINWDKRYVPFPYWPVSVHFGHVLSGQAIMTKFPISDISFFTFEKPEAAPFYYKAMYLDRLVQMAIVTMHGRDVMLMNVHLEAFDTETREKQLVQLRDIVIEAAKKYPIILTGDLNTAPDWGQEKGALSLLIVSSGLSSALQPDVYLSAPESFFTFSSWDPVYCIDYILFSTDHFELVSYRVVREAGEISDHLPVMATLKFLSK